MIRHIVAWKLATDDPDTRAAQAARITDGLLALREVVPEIRDISVGPDVLGGGNWDLALVADFDDATALSAYVGHPEHQKVVEFVRSVVSDRVAVDFEI